MKWLDVNGNGLSHWIQSFNSNKTLMWSMVYLDYVINVVC